MATPYLDALGQGTFGRSFIEENPLAGYGQALGVGFGVTPRQQYLRGLYPQSYQDYLSRIPQRGPNYSWVDYLGEQGPQLQAQWGGLSPQQRGEHPGAYQGPVRWAV